jgi:DNA-binding winged helix-turn-helix (wHTH) protein
MGPTDFRLLRLFVENPDQVLSREDITRHVWFGAAVKDVSINVYIKAVREAIEPLRASLSIETVRNEGFRMSTVTAIGAMASSKSQAPRPVIRGKRAGEKSRAKGTRREPDLVSDLDDAIEKIRRLRATLKKQAKEISSLRDELKSARTCTSPFLVNRKV